MNFQKIQQQLGLRFSFNILPQTFSLAVQFNIPISLLYNTIEVPQIPFHDDQTMCKVCKSFKFPKQPKQWKCSFCRSNNIGQQQMFQGQQRKQSNLGQNGIIFIVDVQIQKSQLQKIKQVILLVVKNLPQHIYIGLILYSRYIFVLNLTNFKYQVYSKGYSPQTFGNLEGFLLKNKINNFVKQIKYIRQHFLQIISQINNQEWPIPKNQRPWRTMEWIEILSSIVFLANNIVFRVAAIIGGPSTIGQFKILSKSLYQNFRNINLLLSNNNNKYPNSFENYFLLRNTVIDVFAFGLDQFGLYQIRQLIENTGGFIIMHQEFGDIFKQSFLKLYTSNQQLMPYYLNAKVKIYHSKNLKIVKIISQGKILQKNQYYDQWFLGSIIQSTTLTVYFEHQFKLNEKFTPFQLITTFKNSNNTFYTRVVSCSRQCSRRRDMCLSYFDQYSAFIALAKSITFKGYQEQSLDLKKKLDRILLKFINFSCQRSSISLSIFLNQKIKLIPQFIYNLRKSHMINSFGISPDQLVFFRSCLKRQNLENSLSMIQPYLLKYTMDNPKGTPISLQSNQLQSDCIIIMDSYFQIVYWEGGSSHYWKLQKFYQKEQYSYIKQMYDNAKEEVLNALENRFPFPNYIESWQDSSNQRYLKSKLHKILNQEESKILTDEASLAQYTKHLFQFIKSNK